MAASLWEPVSFKENINTPDAPKNLLIKSHQDRRINMSKLPKLPNHSNKRKSKRKQIHLTRQYLESLGIPTFEDEAYDNGYLYTGNIDDNASSEIESDDAGSSTTNSYIANRIRPHRITKANKIKTNHNRGIDIELDGDDSDEELENDSFYESDCNDSVPFAINTSSVHTVPLSSDLLRIIKSSHNINRHHAHLCYEDHDATNHTPRASKSNTKKTGRPKSVNHANHKKQRRMNINDLDPLTKLFFEYAKEVTSDLIHHKKARCFTELALNDLNKFEWNDVIKQIVDLETVNNQLLNGHYFNDETYLISSFKQWKSDIKTVFENFAILYGPNKHRKNENYVKIYNNCYVMLCFFNNKLMEIQKSIKKITKRNEDWSKHKNGKYCQYFDDKQEILCMIYDKEMDECKNRDIQSMDFVFICPKRKLQLKHGKFNKKHIDVLPLRTLQKLARRGLNRSNRKGVNGTAIREQKKYFWAQHLHKKNSLQSAMKKLQKESVRNKKFKSYNDRNYCHDIEYSDDDIDSDEDFVMDLV